MDTISSPHGLILPFVYSVHQTGYRPLWTFAAEAFNGFDVGNDSHEDEHYDIGKYRLPGKPDENLVNGINNVLRTKEDFSEMVDGLFGKNRVNTIHELKMIGSKDLSR